MKSKLDITLGVLIALTLVMVSILAWQWQPIRAYISHQQEIDTLATPTPTPNTLFEIKVKKIGKFLELHKSPLYPYARLIVEEADKNNIDYRLLPAIAMNESTLCKNIHEASYNCWGWGIYGNTITRFDSYPDAITTISRGLRKNYYDKGMSSPEAIMKAYTPSSPDGIWAKKILWSYRQIDKQ